MNRFSQFRFFLAHLFLAIVASVALPALASDLPRQPDVVVTATRIEQTIGSTLADVSVIDRDAIDASASLDIADLLRLQAGVDIARTGGPGSQTTVFLRGTNNNHVLVLIDGVRVASLNTGAYAFEQLPLDLIERIEIVRGPRASFWGSDAIGGVIQIFTRKLEGPRISAGYGSYGDANGTIGYGHWTDAGGFSAQVGARHTDGFKSQNENGFNPSPSDDGLRNRNLALRGGVKLGEQDLSAVLSRSQGEVEFSGGSSDVIEQAANVSLQGGLADGWQHRLDIAQSREDLETSAYSARFESRRTSMGWQNQFQLGNDQSLTAGIDHHRERGVSIDTFSGTPSYREDRRNTGVYGGWQGSFGTLETELSLRHDDNSVFGTANTGSVALGWHLSPSTRAYLSYGQGFRGPTLNEQFSPGFGGFFAGNPDLDPERSRSAELGFEFTPAPHQRFTASLYSTRIRNLVSFTGPMSRAENVQHARIDGTELAYSGSGGAWVWSANTTLQNPQNEDTNSQLLRRAKFKANVVLERNLGSAFYVGGELVHAGKRDDFGGIQLPSYNLLNLRASWRFASDWRMTARIENLTDRNYELVRGYNTPGRSGFVEMVWQPGQ
ncbi:MAG: TonB-dependent receptor [Dokdonella sp.]